MCVAIKYQKYLPSAIIQGMQIKTRKCLLTFKIHDYYLSSPALLTEKATISYLASCCPQTPCEDEDHGKENQEVQNEV